MFKFKFFKANYQTTIEEIKQQYRQLAIKHHPDLGGKLEDMQAVNAEFDYLRKHNFNIHEGQQKGSTYTDYKQDTPDSVTANFEHIIAELIKMQGVVIEVCGSFLWLDGETYDHRAEIKALGFKWANKKRRWFLAPDTWRKRGRYELSMGEIRANYGSYIVGKQEQALLTA